MTTAVVAASACAAEWTSREARPEPVATTAQAESAWQSTQDLFASDAPAASSFGQEIVAAPGVVVVGDFLAQAVYVFEPSGRTWKETAKLVPPDDGKKTIGFRVGSATARSVFLVRSTVEDLQAGRDNTILLYERAGGGWALRQELVGDSKPFEKFGSAIATWGTTLAVGALDNSRDENGAVYIFERQGDTFVRSQKILADNTTRRMDMFGGQVALAEGVLVVGSLDEPLRANPSDDQGAFYAYTQRNGHWVLEGRHPLAPGDGNSLCFAANVLAGGTNVRSDAFLFRYGPLGFVRETSLQAGAAPSRVLCSGDRIAAYSLVTSKLVSLYAPAPSGWNRTDLSVGDSTYGSVAINDDGLFVGVAGSPPHVRVLTFGKLAGERCSDDNACAARFCIDGVCCDSACGNGDPNDCQACSRAAGTTADGKCEVLTAAHVCRKARETCDVADTCDGTNKACPADGVTANGAECPGGNCRNGTCVTKSEGAAPDAAAGTSASSHEEDLDHESGGGCHVAAHRGSTTWGLAGASAMLGLLAHRRRRRPNASASE